MESIDYIFTIFEFGLMLFSVAMGTSFILFVVLYKKYVLDIFWSVVLAFPASFLLYFIFTRSFVFQPIYKLSRLIVGFEHVPLLWGGVGFFLMVAAAIMGFTIKRKK